MIIVDLLFNNALEIVISFILGALSTNRRTVMLWFQSLIRWNKKIRFSISYLYKVKIDDQYLLIKGKNIEQYQPIGGVYKYEDSFHEKVEKWGITFEDPKGFYESGDLRFFTKGRYVKEIINWFDIRKNREVNVFREFNEELIAEGVLPLDSLLTTKFEYMKTIKTKIEFSTHFQTDEILIYDIFRVHLSKQNIDKIRKELKKNNSELILVNAIDIEKGHYQVGKLDRSIGDHAKHIL